MLSRGEGEEGGRGGGEEQQSVKAGEASPPPSNLRCTVYPPPSLAHRDNCRWGRERMGGA